MTHRQTIFTAGKLLFTLVILFSACGRKQKNIFSFADQNIPQINRLGLPVVRGVSATHTGHTNMINWLTPQLATPFTAQQLSNKNFSDFFIGYNVYRLVRNNIIPKMPLNKNPLKTTFYIDKKIKHHKRYFYLIKTVFVINKQTLEGPASAITGTSSQK